MKEEEFEKYKDSLAIQRLEKPKKLSAEALKYWSEITSQQYNFDRGKLCVDFTSDEGKRDFYIYIYLMHVHRKIQL